MSLRRDLTERRIRLVPDREIDDNEIASWVESRRLIISQLRDMSSAIRGLSEKIEMQNEKGRDRISTIENQMQTSVSDIKVRISMLEVRAKIWGGMVGLIGG